MSFPHRLKYGGNYKRCILPIVQKTAEKKNIHNYQNFSKSRNYQNIPDRAISQNSMDESNKHYSALDQTFETIVSSLRESQESGQPPTI